MISLPYSCHFIKASSKHLFRLRESTVHAFGVNLLLSGVDALVTYTKLSTLLKMSVIESHIILCE